MYIYGIIRTVWNGNNYVSNPNEDIFLYLSKEERDKEMAECVNNSDIQDNNESNGYKVKQDAAY